MKKLFALLLLAPLLGGCWNPETLQLLTGTYKNPVTKEMLFTAENAGVVIFAGMKAYKSSCAQGAIPIGCKAVVANLQTRTRKLPQLLTDLRAFVKNNDQVGAVTAYNAVVVILNDVKAIANANNVKVQ